MRMREGGGKGEKGEEGKERKTLQMMENTMNQKSLEMFPALLTTDSECGLFIAVNRGLEPAFWEEMDANGLHAIHILSVSAINTALCIQEKKKRVHCPGIEPGSQEWESYMIPLH